MRVVWSTYKKIRIGILRAVPWSFMVSRVTTGVVQIVFSYFIYIYFMKGNLNSQFSQYTDGADYMTYIVLGAALNVLAVSTLMNIGRALITELHVAQRNAGNAAACPGVPQSIFPWMSAGADDKSDA